MEIKKKFFGRTAAGEAANLYTLRNDQGMRVQISNYGGTVVSIRTSDRHGQLGEVTLGFPDLAQYERYPAYYGCIVGRFANRIENGRFTLDGTTYQLAQNYGAHHIHGGERGFDKVIWQAQESVEQDRAGLYLRYQSPDGEENYPGMLNVQVVYSLDNDNALTIDYQATTDKKTVINMTNHTYFNLSGSADILDHHLLIPARRYLRSDGDLIPTGEIVEVAGTPLDFTTFRRIGDRIDEENEDLRLAGGYDHSYVMEEAEPVLQLAAAVYDPQSGRKLETYTTEPDIHFYSGNFLDQSIRDRQGRPLRPRAGLCLEAQHFPDAPNKPHFPSTVLAPGESYRQTTIYKFPAAE